MDTWKSHQQFQDQIDKLRAFVYDNGQKSEVLEKIGEDLETYAGEMMKSVTNAVNEVDSTKLQIMNYLDRFEEKQNADDKISRSSFTHCSKKLETKEVIGALSEKVVRGQGQNRQINRASLSKKVTSSQGSSDSRRLAEEYVSFKSESGNELSENRSQTHNRSTEKIDKIKKSIEDYSGFKSFRQDFNETIEHQQPQMIEPLVVPVRLQKKEANLKQPMDFEESYPQGILPESQGIMTKEGQEIEQLIDPNIVDSQILDKHEDITTSSEEFYDFQDHLAEAQSQITSPVIPIVEESNSKMSQGFSGNKIDEANKEDEEDSFEHEDDRVELRDRLPAFKNPGQKLDIWKVIKDNIGKDLSKIAVPVYFNEPTSMLQKIAEVMEYN